MKLSYKSLSVHIAILLAFVVYVGIIEMKFGNPIKIVSYGPTKTMAGQKFNNGKTEQSAMWFKTEGELSDGMVLMWQEMEINVVMDKKNNVVTAAIPPDLYAKKSYNNLYLLSTKNNKRSNVVVFVVY